MEGTRPQGGEVAVYAAKALDRPAGPVPDGLCDLSQTPQAPT